MKIDNNEVGKRIKNIRITLGKTTADFGFLVGGASGSLVSRWERGVNLPNNERLKRIAELGNITVEELLYGPAPKLGKMLSDQEKNYLERIKNTDYESLGYNNIRAIRMFISLIEEIKGSSEIERYLATLPEFLYYYTAEKNYPNQRSAIKLELKEDFSSLLHLLNDYYIENIE